MADKQFELIYSQQSGDYIKGRAYSNPRFFTTPRQGVTKVLLVGDWPKIRAAYEALGVPVEQLDAEDAVGSADDGALAAKGVVSGLTPDKRAKVYIPEDWAELPWSKPTDAGLTLRGLAAVFSDTPVLKKADAIEAIEAELKRRHTDETAANGLTRREMNADLEAMGVEADPTLDIEDLAKLRNEKRAGRNPE